MLRFKLISLGLVSLVVLSPVTAFALDDGWYHAVDVQAGCREAQSAVVYLESDVPLSLSITGASAQIEESKKITMTKTQYVFNAGSQRATVVMWKNKSNQILLKVLQANGCMGTEVKFAK